MTIVKTNREALPSFSNLFDDFFNTELGHWRRSNFSESNTTLPKVNIKEDDNGFIVEMAAPGMKKSDFNIELDHHLLTISSEREEENNGENSKYSNREFAYHSFHRSFTLPESANGEKIKASYEDGILEIAIPKKEEAKPKPPRTISIS
ncbi:MAG: Hsp20/alpha crystallin family protein [Cyanobacteria bacterium P01_F01_bin.143]